MGTSEALDYLRALSHDSDSEVAAVGKERLKEVDQPPEAYTVGREDHPLSELEPPSK